MFDGIDLTTLITRDAAPLLALYTGPLGFTVAEQGPLRDPAAWRACWGRDGDGPMRAWLLGKAGSAGGWLRVVADPAAPPDPAGPATIARAGPHALDYYVRDLAGLHDRLVAGGAAVRSPPQEYALPGAGFTVRECLLEAPLGLVHALVGYLPERHRCVLGGPAGQAQAASETAAVVWVVPGLDAALGLLTGPLDASVYLDQVWSGAHVERLMGLAPGTSFRMTLARGAQRRNARLEFIEQAPRPPAALPLAALLPPPVILGCGVPDAAALHARLAGGEHGAASSLLTLAGPGGGGRRFGFAASCGVAFEFFDRPGSR